MLCHLKDLEFLESVEDTFAIHPIVKCVFLSFIWNPCLILKASCIGFQVLAILDKIKKENEEKEARSQADNQHESSNQKDEDGENWEDDDPIDDGIIYVE